MILFINTNKNSENKQSNSENENENTNNDNNNNSNNNNSDPENKKIFQYIKSDEEEEEDEDEEDEDEEDEEESLQNMNDLQIEEYVERIGQYPRDECDEWNMVYNGGAILRYSYCNFSQWHIEDQTVSNITITRPIFTETTFIIL